MHLRLCLLFLSLSSQCKHTVLYVCTRMLNTSLSPHLMGWEQAAQTPCLSVSLAATDLALGLCVCVCVCVCMCVCVCVCVCVHVCVCVETTTELLFTILLSVCVLSVYYVCVCV